MLGGTQSLHTNALDEALALPTDFSARIARNTQLVLQEETGITNVVDPLGGSYYVEALTAKLVEEARALIAEVDAAGGMTAYVASGMPKLRSRKRPPRARRAVDRGEDGDRRGQQVRRSTSTRRSTRSTSTTTRSAKARSPASTRPAKAATRRSAMRRSTRWPRAQRATAISSPSPSNARAPDATLGEISPRWKLPSAATTPCRRR